MDTFDIQMLRDGSKLKLPRLQNLRRPKTNYFKEKDRSESIPLKPAVIEANLVSRGKSRDHVRTLNSKVMEINGIKDSSPKNGTIGHAKPITKNIAEWTKRITFDKRNEMAMKNLIILIFDGVVGDCFKKNLWEEGPIKFYLRRGVTKELKKLLSDFQVVLFFVSPDIKVKKVLKYFSTKDIIFDAVYKSRNLSKFNYSSKFSKNTGKKPLKFSENFQDYSQVYSDFGLEDKVHEKVLIVTSISLSPEDFERKGEEMLYHNTSNSLMFFLWYNLISKAIPIQKSASLPVLLAVPDPRLHYNFLGASFVLIVQTIKSLAQDIQDWTAGFSKTPIEKLETDIFNKSFALEKFAKKMRKKMISSPSNVEDIKSNRKDPEKHKVIVLKTAPLTNYHYIENYRYLLQ
jgi:hypothetical protein